MTNKTLVNPFVSLVVILAPMALSCQAQSQRPMFTPAPGSPFTVGRQPGDIAVGDVNRDGKLDIVTANTGSNDVTVLLGNGKRGFLRAPGSPFDAGPAPHLVALGDFNRDDKVDLALTSHDSNDVIVLFGNGRGGFAFAPGSPFPALRGTRPHNHGLVLGDVNRDGNLDITTANQDASSVSVLLGNGKGGFTPAPSSPVPVGREPYLHGLGDVNGDGTLDLITPNVRGNNVTVLLGNGKGGFTAAPGSPYPVKHRPYFVAVGDVNGDHKLDLITTHDDITLVSVLLGDGSGGFARAPGSPFDAGQRGWKVALGDVNRDGRMDLVTGTSGSAVAVLLGDGTGSFTPAPGSPFVVGRGPWGVALGDVNGDGKLDLLTANSDSNNVTVLLGN